jgi:type IV pilus assembly protein PilV
MSLKRRITQQQLPHAQRGLSLLEGLISILIFSFGILGLVGLQGASIRNSVDAKYRADASYLANQIIGQMWADRDATNLPTFVRQNYAHGVAAGVAPNALTNACTTGASVSTNANMTNSTWGWLVRVGQMLPGAAANRQQIAIQGNVVTVTVCWQAPQDANFHNVRLTTNLNFN